MTEQCPGYHIGKLVREEVHHLEGGSGGILRSGGLILGGWCQFCAEPTAAGCVGSPGSVGYSRVLNKCCFLKKVAGLGPAVDN